MRLLPVLALRPRLVGVAVALHLVGAPTLSAQSNAPSPNAAPVLRAAPEMLRRTLDSLATAHRGVVGYSITNLATGEHLERRGDETFPTASLIKVPILVTLFGLAEQKQLTLGDPIVLTGDRQGRRRRRAAVPAHAAHAHVVGCGLAHEYVERQYGDQPRP